MNRAKMLVIAICFLLAKQEGIGQVGMWHLLTVRYAVNPNWTLNAETQLRTAGVYDYWNYRDLKLGITWKSPSNVRYSMFTGRFQNFQPGGNFVRPLLGNEFRLWWQVALSQKLDRFLIEHRYRFDLRFLGGVRQERYRYKLGLAYPFAWKPGEPKIWQAGVGEELSLTDKTPYFQRSRLNLLLGRKMNNSFNLQAQFIDQFDYKKEIGNWSRYILLNGQIDLGKKGAKNS